MSLCVHKSLSPRRTATITSKVFVRAGQLSEASPLGQEGDLVLSGYEFSLGGERRSS